MVDILQQIQQLQFNDPSMAEDLLLSFIREHFNFDVESLELRPSPISLNSFNGFMHLSDGKRYFFKTHTEADTVINEYYHAEMLATEGYPIIQPIFASNEVGKQFLVYEVIESSSVFDTAWAIENGHSDVSIELKNAQEQADKRLFDLYIQSLQWQEAEDAIEAPIHQLFYHRLVGGRLERFYGCLDETNNQSARISLPDCEHSMAEICTKKWVINGCEYRETLQDIIHRSIELLNPNQAGPSIVGHGDAHNGNVFYQGQLLYFDPAFAGRHHPILDLVKPLFHNVFAMWMYYPQDKSKQTNVHLLFNRDFIEISHDYFLHSIRYMFWNCKVKNTLVPILHTLKQQNWLRTDWRAFLKSALFCCPFLTMNLTDNTKFPSNISALGLAMAIEMGSESYEKRSFIDIELDAIENQLNI